MAVPKSEYVKCNVVFSKNKIDSPVVVSSVIQVVVPAKIKNCYQCKENFNPSI